ncbi:hypothetical protein T265_11388 [Opisthorchis viverrini]|uniref:Uncharacterized protein n=1 Tax=Opisthorchis viverrini TaxID=6198 RepID=A0A074YYT3_OPIVI|nr:hypothetical protein T265_11388 [Opisthorchis viverrini]KER19956.1 hypothetical protein T265_11388 [Opisthorchis viverrini]
MNNEKTVRSSKAESEAAVILWKQQQARMSDMSVYGCEHSDVSKSFFFIFPHGVFLNEFVHKNGLRACRCLAKRSALRHEPD